MKIQDLLTERSGNTSVQGVLATIRNIYNGNRPQTSVRLCHHHTAMNIDANKPNDQIVLFGFGDIVVHSALLRDGQLVDQYAGVTASKLLPSGNLQVDIRGNVDELEPVFSVSVGEFLTYEQK